jgi:hypothetical protein
MRDCNANAGDINVGNTLDRRTRRDQIGCFNLCIGVGEGDDLSTLRLGADQRNIPLITRGRIREGTRIRIGDVLQLQPR